METFITVLTVIIEIGSVAFTALMSFWFLHKTLKPKKEGKFLCPTTIISMIVYDLLFQLMEFTKLSDLFFFINHILIFLLIFIYALIFIKGSLLKRLIFSIVDTLIYEIIGYFFVVFWMLAGFSIDAMHESSLIYLSTIIITHLVTFAAYILFVKVYESISLNLNRLETLQIGTVFGLTFIFLLSSIYTASIINDTRVRTLILIMIVLIISISFVIFFMIIKISKNNHIEQENALLRMEKEYQKKKYEDIIRQSEQIKKLRHDYKNNLLVIHSLAEDNNSEKISEFVSKGIELINSTKMHIQTNNEIVNAIVNAKISASSAQGIKVNFISISDFDGIDDFDLCNLISNLFDNAITAVSNCETKIIETKIARKDDIYTIKMSNTIDDSVLDANPELNTTKQDSLHHGYGTKIIKDIADKYNGELDYYEEDGMFHFLVHLLAKPQIESAIPVSNIS